MRKNSNGTFSAEKTYLYEGRLQTVKEIADKHGIKPSTLHKRLARRNGDVEACVTEAFDRNKPIDMAGKKYGWLTVIELAGKNTHGQRLWKCSCECGGEIVTEGYSIRYGATSSCGCLHRESTAQINLSHGMAHKPIYGLWRSMMDRCHLPTSHAYSRYGGRGIHVCEHWQSFENFYADMGDKPAGMSLERIDNDGPYSPENVKWATHKEQANNRRSNVRYAYGDENLTLAQWAENGGLSIGTLWSRLKRGIPFPICLLNLDLKQMRGGFVNAC